MSVSPRPGGYLKIVTGEKLAKFHETFERDKGTSTPEKDTDSSCVCKSAICHQQSKHSPPPTVTIQTPTPKSSVAGMKSYRLSPKDTTRNYRISKALEESDWDVTSVGDIESPDDDDEHLDNFIDKVKPTVNLLISLISTVMLLASGNKAPDDMIDAAEAYLKCIKDDEDYAPPNVQGLLNHIAKMKGAEPPAAEAEE